MLYIVGRIMNLIIIYMSLWHGYAISAYIRSASTVPLYRVFTKSETGSSNNNGKKEKQESKTADDNDDDDDAGSENWEGLNQMLLTHTRYRTILALILMIIIMFSQHSISNVVVTFNNQPSITTGVIVSAPPLNVIISSIWRPFVYLSCVVSHRINDTI